MIITHTKNEIHMRTKKWAIHEHSFPSRHSPESLNSGLEIGKAPRSKGFVKKEDAVQPKYRLAAQTLKNQGS